MTAPATTTSAAPRDVRKSISAVFIGFVTVAGVSLGTDQVLHMLNVYPPWGQPMFDPRLNFLALSYRIVYTVLGSYITASLAPRNPMRHAIILGVIGLIAGTAGVIATLPLHLGPSWYPIAIALTALPCAWLGGFLYVRKPRQAYG
jgi:hypothetical protein